MKENLEKITSGQSHVDKQCIVCEKIISAQDEVVVCPRCKQVHHVDCWKNKGGCGQTGCPQVAQAVRGEKKTGDGPPAPVSKKVVFGSIAAVLALILLIVFWPKPDPAQGRDTIVFMGEAGLELSEIMENLTEEFNANNDETYIDLQLVPPGGLNQKLLVLVAANDAPDVIALTENWFDHYVEEGYLLQLGTDANNQPIYSVQHPAQLSQLVVWARTGHPNQAIEVLHYFAENIPPADLDLLRELQPDTRSIFGF